MFENSNYGNQYCFFLSPVTATYRGFLYRGVRSQSSRTRLRFSSHRGDFVAKPFGKDKVSPRHGGSILSGSTVILGCCAWQVLAGTGLNGLNPQPPKRDRGTFQVVIFSKFPTSIPVTFIWEFPQVCNPKAVLPHTGSFFSQIHFCM